MVGCLKETMNTIINSVQFVRVDYTIDKEELSRLKEKGDIKLMINAKLKAFLLKELILNSEKYIQVDEMPIVTKDKKAAIKYTMRIRVVQNDLEDKLEPLQKRYDKLNERLKE